MCDRSALTCCQAGSLLGLRIVRFLFFLRKGGCGCEGRPASEMRERGGKKRDSSSAGPEHESLCLPACARQMRRHVFLRFSRHPARPCSLHLFSPTSAPLPSSSQALFRIFPVVPSPITLYCSFLRSLLLFFFFCCVCMLFFSFLALCKLIECACLCEGL
jgi:hypothetical protein